MESQVMQLHMSGHNIMLFCTQPLELNVSAYK